MDKLLNNPSITMNLRSGAHNEGSVGASFTDSITRGHIFQAS